MTRENFNPERISTLLALALAFGDEAAGENVADGAAPAPFSAAEALAVFASLPPAERAALEARGARHAALPEGERARWIARALNRGRQEHARLDEHIHPSHVAAALNLEPPHVQRFVLRHLPPALAAAAAAMIGVRFPPEETGGAAPIRPAPESARVVRRAFLKNFVTFDALDDPRPLDHLSGIELRRLIRLLGVREVAVACRGVAAVETIAAFLRRFEAEDARAIASHIASLTDLDADRVALAGRLVRHMIDLEIDSGALLFRTGMRVLAAGADWRDERRLRYTAQKLPVEVAAELCGLARESVGHAVRPAHDARGLEVEALAGVVRESQPEGRRAASEAGESDRGEETVRDNSDVHRLNPQ